MAAESGEHGARNESEGSWAARAAAALGLLGAAALVVLAIVGGSGHTYRLMFMNAGQLVEGNQVRIGGQAVGEVAGIELTDDARAEVTVELDEPLKEGATAVIRAASLSGIANRYVALSPGPPDAPRLADGAVLATRDTTAAVDLDQLIDALDSRARRDLAEVIAGQATIYSGAEREANATYRYLAPALHSSERLLGELTRDEPALAAFLVEGSRAVGALAERRQDLSALVGNANRALGAVAAQGDSVARALSALPPTMRQANTTFSNLRAALDDLDPLVAEAKPATRDLAGFLRDLRPVAERAVPVFGDLRLAVDAPGRADDLSDVLGLLPRVHRRARAASRESIEAMDASQEVVAFARPYAPELLAFLTKFGQITAYYDANGHYARVQSAAMGAFDWNPATGLLDPSYPPSNPLQDLELAHDLGRAFQRCPGAATQPIPGSNPFLDDGDLLGDCEPGDVPPGP